MGLYIEDMEMPPEGKASIILIRKEQGENIAIVKHCQSYADKTITKHLVTEVPPHGRLIDADKLIKAYRPLIDSRIWCSNFIMDLENAPTVIP